MGKYNQDIIQLIYKFVNNQCSEEEWAQVLDILENKENTKEWEYVMEDRWRDPRIIKVLKEKYFRARNGGFNSELTIPKGNSSKFQKYRKWLVVAAALAVLIVSSLVLLKYSRTNSENPATIVRSDIQIKRVSMKDGSTVWLNKNSQISYTDDFGDSVRQVQLIGHGFFDVARDTSRQFIVRTKNLKIQVLGTSFDVFSHAGATEEKVVVATGEVKVQQVKSSEEFVLLPGDELIYDNNRFRINKKSDVVEKETSWRTEALRFEDESLGTIVTQLEKIYDLRLEFDDPSLASKRITLKPRNADWSSILAVLELVAKVDIEEVNENSTILKIRSNGQIR